MVLAIMRNNYFVSDQYRPNPPVVYGKELDNGFRGYKKSDNHYIIEDDIQKPINPIFRGQIMANRYSIQSLLGKGSFGHVVLARETTTNQEFAVKILNSQKSTQSVLSEINALKFLNRNDSKNLFVRFFGDFIWKDYHCLIFELLGDNLYDHLKHRNFVGLPFLEVSDIAVQLVNALAHLCVLNIIHCDIKPENIAFVRGSSKIKLIDFGSSCSNGKTIYRYIQSRFYRAVEVILELGYDYKIDTWSVGCVLGELITGSPLFPGNNEHEQLVFFTKILGPIPFRMALSSSKFPNFFYFRDQFPEIKIPEKFHGMGSIPLFNILQRSSSIVKHRDAYTGDIIQDQRVLYLFDMIARMLIYEPGLRISPGDLLSHPLMPQSNSPIVSSKNHSSHSMVPVQMVSPVCLESHYPPPLSYIHYEQNQSYQQSYNQVIPLPIPYVVDFSYPVQVHVPAQSYNSNQPSDNMSIHVTNNFPNNQLACSCIDCSYNISSNLYHYIDVPKTDNNRVLF